MRTVRQAHRRACIRDLWRACNTECLSADTESDTTAQVSSDSLCWIWRRSLSNAEDLPRHTLAV